jgi:hypothetical protein
MKTFRFSTLASVVAAISLAALDVNIVTAGPLRHKLVKRNPEAVSEWVAKTIRKEESEIANGGERFRSLVRGSADWLRNAEVKIEDLFEEAKGVFRQAGWQAESASRPAEQESARSRETESQQVVSSLISQAEQSITENLRAKRVAILSEEELQGLIKAAIAHAAEAGSKKPNSKYSFNPRTGMLRFSEPWVVGKLAVDRDINLYATIAIASTGRVVYLSECAMTKDIKECVDLLFAKIREQLRMRAALGEARKNPSPGPL